MIVAFCSSTFMIMNGLQYWSENPILISVDSLENPLKDIEFPAITICPDFKPDQTALTELVFNLFEYNCDLGNKNCDNIRQDFKYPGNIIFNAMESIIDKVQFEKKSYNFDMDYSNCTTKKWDLSKIPCMFPFENNGLEHYECIWEDHPNNEYRPWCITNASSTDSESELIDWGNCELGCPFYSKPEGIVLL